jgi:hypothetical protein
MEWFSSGLFAIAVTASKTRRTKSACSIKCKINFSYKCYSLRYTLRVGNWDPRKTHLGLNSRSYCLLSNKCAITWLSSPSNKFDKRQFSGPGLASLVQTKRLQQTFRWDANGPKAIKIHYQKILPHSHTCFRSNLAIEPFCLVFAGWSRVQITSHLDISFSLKCKSNFRQTSGHCPPLRHAAFFHIFQFDAMLSELMQANQWINTQGSLSSHVSLERKTAQLLLRSHSATDEGSKLRKPLL